MGGKTGGEGERVLKIKSADRRGERRYIWRLKSSSEPDVWQLLSG